MIQFSLVTGLVLGSSPAKTQDYGGARTVPNDDFVHISLDLSLGAGSTPSRTYAEYGLGVNAFLSEFLIWRNAIYARSESGVDTTYGLDSSARGIVSFKKGQSGFALFAGPGLRLPIRGLLAPFVEFGLILKEGGLTIGGGAKTILNSLPRSGSEDDNQLFIILGTGASL